MQLSDLHMNLEFSEPRQVMTRHGPRMLRTATPTAEFWDVWKDPEYKSLLKNNGFSVVKRDITWEVCHWEEIP